MPMVTLDLVMKFDFRCMTAVSHMSPVFFWVKYLIVFTFDSAKTAFYHTPAISLKYVHENVLSFLGFAIL